MAIRNERLRLMLGYDDWEVREVARAALAAHEEMSIDLPANPEEKGPAAYS